MAYKALYNFGNVRILDASPIGILQYNSILFGNSMGKITYKTIYNYDYETNTGKRIPSIKGYRVKIDVTIIALTDSDSVKLYNFINLLNRQANIGGIQKPIWIYPRYDSTKLINDWYLVYYVGNIFVDDIANVNRGQILNLTFESKLLATNLSTNISFSSLDVTDDNGDILTVDIDGNDFSIGAITTDLIG